MIQTINRMSLYDQRCIGVYFVASDNVREQIYSHGYSILEEEQMMAFVEGTRMFEGLRRLVERKVASLWKKRNDVSANIILPKGWRNTD